MRNIHGCCDGKTLQPGQAVHFSKTEIVHFRIISFTRIWQWIIQNKCTTLMYFSKLRHNSHNFPPSIICVVDKCINTDLLSSSSSSSACLHLHGIMIQAVMSLSKKDVKNDVCSKRMRWMVLPFGYLFCRSFCCVSIHIISYHIMMHVISSHTWHRTNYLLWIWFWGCFKFTLYFWQSLKNKKF